MYILGTYQHENPVLVLVHTEYTLFLCFRTQPGQSDMYQCILGMYWHEHFRRVSSRVSGFQMGHPSGTLPTLDIECQTFDIGILRYCNWNVRYRALVNDLRYRDTILHSIWNALEFDIECSKSGKHRYQT